jgi:hypothetical protein
VFIVEMALRVDQNNAIMEIKQDARLAAEKCDNANKAGCPTNCQITIRFLMHWRLRSDFGL